MTNNFFPFLNWVLKVTKKRPEIPNNVQFITNKWLSMTSAPIAKIVNATLNRWKISDMEYYATISHAIIPKYAKRIEYIKKSPKEDTEEYESLENLASSLELSKKEVEMMLLTLEELNLNPK
jgi:hypothetical protein